MNHILKFLILTFSFTPLGVGRIGRPLVLTGLSLLLTFSSHAQPLSKYPEIKFFEKVPIETEVPEKEKKEEEKKKEAKEEAPAPIENIWTEVHQGPDGKLYYYTPPKIVLDFIMNPTKENARTYLQWNQQRLAMYERASQVLMEVAMEEGVIPEEKFAGIEKPPPVPKPARPKLLFFSREGCPYCKDEIPIVEKFIKEHPDEFDFLCIYTTTKEEPPKLPFTCIKDTGESQRYSVTTYPSLVFIWGGEDNFGIEGFVSHRELEKIYKKEKEKKK